MYEPGTDYSFNPRPREGATQLSTDGGDNYGSFNPRPREGATPGLVDNDAPLLGFNPRPREGATRENFHVVHGSEVSIHAPVKGRPAARHSQPF